MERSHRDTDRREVELRLSSAGRQLVSDVTARRRRDLRRVLAKIPVADQTRLIEALRVFTAAAGEPADSAMGLGLSL
jgi:DNA-binding MarR family transcriptional regulator